MQSEQCIMCSLKLANTDGCDNSVKCVSMANKRHIMRYTEKLTYHHAKNPVWHS